MPGRTRYVYTIINPQGVEVVQGCYLSDAVAEAAFDRTGPTIYRRACKGPFRKRALRAGEHLAAGGLWRDLEDHNFLATDPPPWFEDAVRSHARESGELLALLVRRATYLSQERDRQSVPGVEATGGADHLLQLLWTAMGVLHASGIVSQVRPA